MLIVVLAAHEDSTGMHSRRSDSGITRRYFGWQADNGYPRSDFEALAAPRKTMTSRK